MYQIETSKGNVTYETAELAIKSAKVRARLRGTLVEINKHSIGGQFDHITTWSNHFRVQPDGRVERWVRGNWLGSNERLMPDGTIVEAAAALARHAATLPTTRDLIHVCAWCGEREERFIETPDGKGKVECGHCGHVLMLK